MGEREYISLSGTVDTLVYQNEDNGYTVLRMESEDGELVTVVGCIPSVMPGEELEAFGDWETHPQHGRQFRARWSQRSLPDTEEGIYRFLASGAIKGIGPATATLLLTRFGAATLDVIESAPERLAELRGFSRKKAMQVSEDFRKQVSLRRLMEFLSAHELRPQLALRLYQLYGGSAYSLVQENPYILSTEAVGEGFDEADRLALSMGFSPDSPQRLAAAVLHELAYNSTRGHVFIPRDKLIAVTAQLLGADEAPIAAQLDKLIERAAVVSEQIAGVEACYLQTMYEAESYTAARLLEMNEGIMPEEKGLDRLIEQIEAEDALIFAPQQLDAIYAAARHKIMLITGGPGTGKTTCVRAIVRLLHALNLKVALAAPTGRAAKRLETLSGQEAKTIHRLLEATGLDESDTVRFRRCESNPLSCDAVILDEASMIDIGLMRALLLALPPRCRLILVGDADQLPSVGPGRVFSDMIRAGVFKTIRLNEIFRQASGSSIVQAAHEINHGEVPSLTRKDGDFFFLRRQEAERAAETIVELYSRRLPDNMHIPVRELQLLTPTHKGPLGTRMLNVRLQAALNPPAEGKKEHAFGERIFREGDRVMQNRNNYDLIWYRADAVSTTPDNVKMDSSAWDSPDKAEPELDSLGWAEEDEPMWDEPGEFLTLDTHESGLGIFNGDIGHILKIDESERALLIDFEGKLTKYSYELLADLEHAWAISVHKSQGGEFRGVILSAMPAPPRLMTRAVLYTAVTRAKELLVAVGDENVLHRMVTNERIERRYSGLRARLAHI
ncbi:MAG: AAA family ATPase [Oscillospiraceae bacterium]|nr:AAA family ATPase [Oscillospiraceae bacterium]